MKIKIQENKIIKEQELEINKEVTIIYGYNNSGKTTILREINKSQYKIIKENYFNKQRSDISLYIPTNRVIVNKIKTKYTKMEDLEDVINYEKDMLKDYDLHLKKIRDYLMQYIVVNKYINKIINKLFNIKLPLDEDEKIKNDIKYSDGIENIINIYLNVIWILTWDQDLSELKSEQFEKELKSNKVFIMIDEIEMFLHVNIQSKLINTLKESFQNSSFIFTTHSPLLLTRYKDADVYNIENGKLDKIDESLFYEDLDNIFEAYFEVGEIPDNIKESINYLGDVIMKGSNIDNEKILKIEELLIKDYPNIWKKYNKLIAKAKDVGEKYV